MVVQLLSPRYWFGIPRNVEFVGFTMDVDRMAYQLVSKKNRPVDSLKYAQAVGARGSAMEHVVPEQMFSLTQKNAEGISAVKAIELAAQQGQKIWTINSVNLNPALASINLDSDAENDIRNAVSAGKVVTTHEADISFNGWVGNGYIILDAETGAGAYIIAGGNNGSFIQVAIQYRMVYSAGTWGKIRSDRTKSEATTGFDEALRNAEHFLWAYQQVCDEGSSRASAVTLTYAYFIMKAYIYDANVIIGGAVSIPFVGVFDFRGSPLTFDQLSAGLTGAAYGSKCRLD